MRSVDRNDEPVPFSIEYLTFSEQKKSGGEWRRIDQAIVAQGQTKARTRSEVLRRKYADTHTSAQEATPHKAKKPDHKRNLTMQIMDCSTRQLVKIRPIFIMAVNGIQVEL